VGSDHFILNILLGHNDDCSIKNISIASCQWLTSDPANTHMMISSSLGGVLQNDSLINIICAVFKLTTTLVHSAP